MKHLYVSPELCTGCKECSLACSLGKFGECNPKKAAISVVRDEFERFEYPIICMQCEDAPCLKFCPQNAYYKESTPAGEVIKYNEDKCIKCRFCATICPYCAIAVLDNDVVKCDLCTGDPEKRGPKCAKVCSTGALKYEEETTELNDRRKTLARKVLGEKMAKASKP
ncbi:MAG: 4Fe-4S dicluster domain-containing protein [Candidatus Brocadiia bacterium]